MQEPNKEVIRVSEEGILFMDYLPCDFISLINLIAEDNCILIYDSKEAYNKLQSEISKYVRKEYCIELGERVIKFIAEQYTQQVLVNSI